MAKSQDDQNKEALLYWVNDLKVRFETLCTKISQDSNDNPELKANEELLHQKCKNELPGLLKRQHHSKIDPDLLKWEQWTNELIKWSEQQYSYVMPPMPEFSAKKVETTYKKFLALFLKELNDKAPTHYVAKKTQEIYKNDSASEDKSPQKAPQLVKRQSSTRKRKRETSKKKSEESKETPAVINEPEVRLEETPPQIPPPVIAPQMPKTTIERGRTDPPQPPIPDEDSNLPFRKKMRINDDRKSIIKTNSGVLPFRVYENINKICQLSNEGKELMDKMNQNHGTLNAIYLAQLNIAEDKPDMKIENVLGLLNDINDRSYRIATNAFNNVYRKKHEWYRSNKEYFKTPINSSVYVKNCIPLKANFQNQDTGKLPNMPEEKKGQDGEPKSLKDIVASLLPDQQKFIKCIFDKFSLKGTPGFNIHGDAVIIELKFVGNNSTILIEMNKKTGEFFYYSKKKENGKPKNVKCSAKMKDFLKKLDQVFNKTKK
ncbi:unnamed protein product [Moneuplotes crassus]|uniref:Uncharacterized protein n=1 Tax=Euplotes crassus TaxID=5936 RepID=A0AAD1X2W7_EUPCR|nr:unnamed protein product [Moneuplotes crassus]